MKDDKFDSYEPEKDNEYVDQIINNYVKDDSYYNPKKRKIISSFGNNYIIIIICFFVAVIGGFFGSFVYNIFSVTFSEDLNKPSENSTAVSSIVTHSTADAVAKVSDSVVDVETVTQDKMSHSGEAGSGLVYSSDGYIITNEHVIRGAKVINVVLSNGNTYDAKVIGSDSKNDVALLKINETNLTPVKFGDSSTLRKGDDIFVIGNPLGEFGGSVTNGIISAKNREIDLEGSKMSLIQTNAEINSGNSGGGVFKLTGELIGMVIAKSVGDDLEGLGFVIPSNTVKSCIENFSK